jgi:hypothetical protein
MAIVAAIVIMSRFRSTAVVREYTKGGRVVSYQVKAREFTDRKDNIPKLQFFGTMGFAGKIINQPPSECVIPYRGVWVKKMYDLVKKDGLYFPVENLVLGRRYDIPTNALDDEQAKLLEQAHERADELVQYEVGGYKDKRVAYAIEGSGMELSRDYDAESSIENMMLQKAEQYRNQKPSFMYAVYGLAIILAIGSFIVMIYSWNQFGNIADAIAGLKEPLRQGTEAALTQKLGP